MNLVFNFAEDFANLVFDRVRAGRPLLEPVQIRKQFAVDEITEVVTGRAVL